MESTVCLAPSHTFQPEELLCAVPYFVGYVPQDSLVCLFHSGSRAIRLTARLDLELSVTALEDVAAGLVERAPPATDGVVLVGANPASPEAIMTVAALSQRVQLSGLPVSWAGCLVGRRWRSTECDGAGCGLHELSAQQVAPLVAELVTQGFAVAGSRAEIAAEVQRQPGNLAASLPDPRRAELETWRDATIDSVTALFTAGDRPDDAAIGLVAAACCDIRVRDCVLWRLTRANDSTTWMATWRVISAVLRRCPAEATADVAAVAAVTAWQCGDGVRANEALAVAWAANRRQSLAALVRRSVDAGLSPEIWSAVMASLTQHECRWGSRRQVA